jgi:hypothetical protein
MFRASDTLRIDPRRYVRGGAQAPLLSFQSAEVRSLSLRLQTHAYGLSSQAPEKLSRVQDAQSGFLTRFGYNRESHLAFLNVGDCVTTSPCEKIVSFFGNVMALLPSPIVARNFLGSKSDFFWLTGAVPSLFSTFIVPSGSYAGTQ